MTNSEIEQPASKYGGTKLELLKIIAAFAFSPLIGWIGAGFGAFFLLAPLAGTAALRDWLRAVRNRPKPAQTISSRRG